MTTPKSTQGLANGSMPQSHSDIVSRSVQEARRRARVHFSQPLQNPTQNIHLPSPGATYNRSHVNGAQWARPQNQISQPQNQISQPNNQFSRPQPTGVNDFDRMFNEIQDQDFELETVGLDHLVSALSTDNTGPLFVDPHAGLQAYLIRQQLIAGVSPEDVVPIESFPTSTPLNRRSSVPTSVNIHPSDPETVMTIPRIPSPQFDGYLEPLAWYPAMNSTGDSSMELDAPTVLRQEEINQVVDEVLQELFPDYLPDVDCDLIDAMLQDFQGEGGQGAAREPSF
ncbi:hypothetical protein N7456_005295 [Penicillium angulare]|uniref:Uncharacterized protein n=1 Tax=Penicillium angulare TaxID=116970 RepID=A0A9W9FZ08_9EURO|nr:hypothetical protein N7456_005295 [Penicillium angulare]